MTADYAPAESSGIGRARRTPVGCRGLIMAFATLIAAIDRRAEVEDAGHQPDACRPHTDGQAGEVRRRPVRVLL